MDRRLYVRKTLKIGQRDSGQLRFETCQLRAVCRQSRCQGIQFSSDLRQHALELRDNLYGAGVQV